MIPFDEQALAVDCRGDRMVAVVSVPREPRARGVLIVVGGPQYRTGSHRQFTLLARRLAAEGIAAMRFDYRGMGDSEGGARSFEDVNEDVRCALDAFFARVPALREVVLWGLCDGASAALFYAPHDARVGGMVLLNPWVRTEEGIARAQLKHYYAGRFADPELWRKLARGEFDFRAAAAGLIATLRRVLNRGGGTGANTAGVGGPAAPPLPERMLDAFRRYARPALFILSGNDLTAQEFRDAVKTSSGWRSALAAPRVAWRELPAADHTFSTREWRDQVAAWTGEWVRSW